MLAFLTSVVHAADRSFEEEWIDLRNQQSFTGFYPAGYGLRPEDVRVPHPLPKPSFWDDQWINVAERWVSEVYVTARLAREGAARAAQNEVQYLERWVVELNVRAQRACRRNPEDCRRAIEVILTRGLRFALDLAEVRTPDEYRRVAAAFGPLVASASNDENLRTATRNQLRTWRRTAPLAKRLRLWQTAPVMVFGTAGAVVAAREYGLNILTFSAGALSATSPWYTRFLVLDNLPITRRFSWRTNQVGATLAECQRILNEGGAE